MRPPAGLSCPPDHLTSYAGRVLRYQRVRGHTDLVIRTDWDSDALDVFKGQMRALIKDSYNAPLIPTTAKGASCALNNPPSNPDARSLPGCLPYAKRQPGGGRPVPVEDGGDAAPAK